MKATKQQTAVEWLVELLRKYGSPIPREFEEKAKLMEKEQIIEAYDKVSMNTAEQYYTEKYGE